MGYKKDVFSGVAWIGGAQAFTRGLTFLKTVLAARLLTPRDFGQFGAILLVTTLFEIATTFGLQLIIVQQRKVSDEFLSTAWTIAVIRGGLITLGVLATSSLMINFFNDRSLLPLLALVALAPLIKGFINPGMALLQKELVFNKLGVLNGLVSLIEFTTTVILSFLWRNVWALVIGFLMAAVAEMILSFIFSSYRPRLRVNWNEARLILRQSKWLVSSSIFNYSATQGDDLLVGRLLGLQNLGFYQLAYKLANLPLTEVSEILTQVTLPIYTKIGSDLKRLKRAFLKTAFYSTLLSLAMAVFLIIFAHPLVRIILGEKWLPLVSPLRILAVFSIFRSLIENMKPLFFSQGDFRSLAFFDAARTAFLAVLIFPLIGRYQVNGAALAILLSLIGVFPWLTVQTINLIRKGQP
jgi:O-antigen/teichoic acid export membrane protein